MRAAMGMCMNKDESRDEAALVKSYMELTGSSESKARGVFMYIYADHEQRQGENGKAEELNGQARPPLERVGVSP